MKKLFTAICLALVTATALAIPAKKGLYTTLKLDNGTEVRAQLCGDEHLKFYLADDGTRYTRNSNGTYSVADMTALRTQARARRAKIARRQAAHRKSMARAWGDTQGPGISVNGYHGKKKGLIILVDFSDTKFKPENNQAKYNDIANKENYTEGNFVGSVHDYFHDQSNGQFDLTFDVMGPITMKKNYAYYGQNDKDGNDMYVGEMVADACNAIKDQVNFADYDWDDNGEADQVFVIYAGMGEADFSSGGENYIWPHMFYLSESDYGKTLTIDGVVIDTYACTNEITPGGKQDGMGTICHEFSHCLGFPDLYDTDYSGGYGMGYDWDLMHGGNSNGNSFCPPAYSGYERWVAGWKEPVELTETAHIENMKALEQGGETYIIYNDANKNEFYFIDNRQPSKWDRELPGKGLLVTHVNYNKNQWLNNAVNDDPSQQNWTIIAADNKYGDYDTGTDAYPYRKSATNVNDSLTNNSKPAALLYNRNSDGTLNMNKALLNIAQNSDGTMSFTFRSAADNPVPEVKPGNVLFKETFDKCAGKGGNPNGDTPAIWSGSAGSAAFKPDNEGWNYYRAYGAYKCARFGSSQAEGYATTPSFYATGTVNLTCRAGAWAGTNETLTISYGDTEIKSLKLPASQWTDISVSFEGNGDNTLTFSGVQRLFLDEIEVKAVATGIDNVVTNAHNATKGQGRIYTIEGQYVGNNKAGLPHGLYIVNGKKFVK